MYKKKKTSKYQCEINAVKFDAVELPVFFSVENTRNIEMSKVMYVHIFFTWNFGVKGMRDIQIRLRGSGCKYLN